MTEYGEPASMTYGCNYHIHLASLPYQMSIMNPRDCFSTKALDLLLTGGQDESILIPANGQRSVLPQPSTKSISKTASLWNRSLVTSKSSSEKDSVSARDEEAIDKDW